MERSISPDSILMIKAAQAAGIPRTWDRYEAKLPQCGFGETACAAVTVCKARAGLTRSARDRPQGRHLRCDGRHDCGERTGAQHRGRHGLALGARQAPGAHPAQIQSRRSA